MDWAIFSGKTPWQATLNPLAGNFKPLGRQLLTVRISGGASLKSIMVGQLYAILSAKQCFQVFSDLDGHLKNPWRATLNLLAGNFKQSEFQEGQALSRLW